MDAKHRLELFPITWVFHFKTLALEDKHTKRSPVAASQLSNIETATFIYVELEPTSRIPMSNFWGRPQSSLAVVSYMCISSPLLFCCSVAISTLRESIPLPAGIWDASLVLAFLEYPFALGQRRMSRRRRIVARFHAG